jgi:ABC-type uncharacterized transport system permease subunit
MIIIMSTIKVQPIRSTWSPPTFTPSTSTFDATSTLGDFQTEELAYLSIFIVCLAAFIASFFLKRKT